MTDPIANRPVHHWSATDTTTLCGVARVPWTPEHKDWPTCPACRKAESERIRAIKREQMREDIREGRALQSALFAAAYVASAGTPVERVTAALNITAEALDAMESAE